jgi:hypothetical protein
LNEDMMLWITPLIVSMTSRTRARSSKRLRWA